MIPRSVIEQLITRCDIEEVMSSYISLKRAGRNLKAVCPFHSEKTASFVVYPESQSFFCFGCGAGGDVISFIMRAENLDYVEAVRFLARRVGMEIQEDGETDELTKLKSRIYEMNREAARFFHSALKSPVGQKGYEYFKNRGLSDKTITSYGLGYAPDSWDSLIKHLLSKGFTTNEMYQAALVSKGRNGSYYDQFRNRVMFPIIDLRGNVIAFGGRVLDDSKPKYLNSADTPVFKKSRNLFSLNLAKNEIKDKLILAEGYMDVIAINSAGFKNVVATLGTALTDEQARLMSKYASQVVIAYDSDGAGQTATHRAINILSEAGLTARVLHMDGAKDPDEYIKKFGSKRFEMLIDGATDVIEHELNAIKKSVDMDTAEGKIEYLKKAVSVLSEVANPLERDVYTGAVVEASGASFETVKAQTDILLKRKKAQNAKKEWQDIVLNKEAVKDRVNPEKAQNLKEAVAEEGIIAFLFDHPDYYERLLSKIAIDDFVTDFNKRVISAMYAVKKENVDVSLSVIAPAFTQAEVSAISSIIARNSDKPKNAEAFDDYIDILKAHKDRIKDIGNLNPEDLEEYRRKLKAKK